MISVSSRPWMTSVGTSTLGEAPRCGRRWRRSRRAGAARPPGRTPGRTPRRRGRCASLGVEVPLRRATRRVRSAAAMYASRSVGGGASSTASASGVGLPDPRVAGRAHDRRQLRHRSGCSMAIVCTIIPPIDAPDDVGPRRCRGASSRPTASSAMSESVYGTGGSSLAARAAPTCTAIGSTRCAVEVRRQPAVAVVEADDVAAAVGERLAEARRPRRSAGR